jgi:hypothetical protein
VVSADTAALAVVISRAKGIETGLQILVRAGQEDDLAVGRLGHGLHSFEVSNLHGGGRAQDIGSLSH